MSVHIAQRRAYSWQYGIGVPNGDVARTAQDAETIAKQLGRAPKSSFGMN